ncbi:hypothetical protein BU15DRAFT_68784 [Melanogaster broomeanus]|nr:hypothetical protein BU15DRAFT_68784 [Melanogaster broomeanus]
MSRNSHISVAWSYTRCFWTNKLLSQITSDLKEFLDKSSMLPPSSLAQSPTCDAHHSDGENSHPSDGWLWNPAWIAPPVLPPPLSPPLSHDTVTPPVTTHAGAIIPVVSPQMETDRGQNVPVSNMPVRHLVSATMVYLSTEKPTSSRGKLTIKKLCTTKSDQISIDDISRLDFVKAFLQIHELTDQYSPGVHFSPQFKLWWTGSSGGKAGASTIENDHDFSVALAALLKKTKVTSVQVEFDIEVMDGYRVWKWVDHDEDELLHATKVPRTEAFSMESQLHGAIIMQLKLTSLVASQLATKPVATPSPDFPSTPSRCCHRDI